LKKESKSFPFTQNLKKPGGYFGKKRSHHDIEKIVEAKKSIGNGF